MFLIRHRDQKVIDTAYPTQYDGDDDEMGVRVYDGPKEPTDEWLKANGYGRFITQIESDWRTEKTVNVGPFWDGEVYNLLVVVPKDLPTKEVLPTALAIVAKRRKEVPELTAGADGWAVRPLDWQWKPTGLYA